MGCPPTWLRPFPPQARFPWKSMLSAETVRGQESRNPPGRSESAKERLGDFYGTATVPWGTQLGLHPGGFLGPLLASRYPDTCLRASPLRRTPQGLAMLLQLLDLRSPGSPPGLSLSLPSPGPPPLTPPPFFFSPSPWQAANRSEPLNHSRPVVTRRGGADSVTSPGAVRGRG